MFATFNKVRLPSCGMKTFQCFLFSLKDTSQLPKEQLSVCACVPWARREEPQGLVVQWFGTSGMNGNINM